MMPSTICNVPTDYPPEIIGYAHPWIASGGDNVEIKVWIIDEAAW